MRNNTNNKLVVSPLEHQLNIDVRADIKSFDSILAVRCESKNFKVQIFHQSTNTQTGLLPNLYACVTYQKTLFVSLLLFK